MATQTKADIALIAHLFRRAGFGATYEQLEHYAAKGYEETVEELLHPDTQPEMEEDLIMRQIPPFMSKNNECGVHWVFRLINTKRPLEEKIALFWHGILCTGQAKVENNHVMYQTVNLFRRDGFGSFQELLNGLAKDPGMIFYLDNQISHKGSINENWGRELLELFSMGVGNYTEDDIKQAARAFTGWTVSPVPPTYPYHFSPWSFLYDSTDHDDGEKAFLGQTGRFNGEDIIQIICEQEATARFIARHLYSFFVADEPPVPEWSNIPPANPEAIEVLAKAYFEHNYEIRPMLRLLFNSDFFKDARFAKIKSPADVVVGTLRLVKDHTYLKPDLIDVHRQCQYMGQELMNPPSVEGWHTGKEWIDSGTLVERVNYIADTLADTTLPGIQEIVQRLRAKGETLSPEALVGGCLEQLGHIELEERTRQSLVEQAARGGAIKTGTKEFAGRVVTTLQLITSAKEYQFA